MLYKAWSSIEEVPYWFWRSSIKFQDHTAKKIVDFDLDWAFPNFNSSLNSPMAMKCCTKLETAEERCPIVFQGHPSNFKVTRDKTSPILTQIGRFRTIGRSQLSNPSDLPCLRWCPLDINDLISLRLGLIAHSALRASTLSNSAKGSDPLVSRAETIHRHTGIPAIQRLWGRYDMIRYSRNTY